MLKAELEVAVRVTIDLARPVTERERPMLERAIGLAKEVSAMRGVHDPALTLAEQHLGALPVIADPEHTLTAIQIAERRAIVRALEMAQSLVDAARLLGINRATLYTRIEHYQIAHRFGRPRLVETA